MVYYITVECLENIKKEFDDIGHEILIIDQEVKKITKEVDEFKKRIEFLDLKREKSIAVLLELKHKVKKNEYIISNNHIIKTIVVDEKTITGALSNGLVSVNRDVLMRLVKTINVSEKTRNIIGMTETFYTWSKLPIFRWASSGLLKSFLPKIAPEGVVYKQKRQVNYFGSKECTISLDTPLLKAKIFILDMVAGGYMVGLASKTLFPKMHNESAWMRSGVCEISCLGCLSWGTNSVRIAKESSFKSVASKVTLELDASLSLGTLRFFVEDVQLPHAVTGVPCNGGVCFVLGFCMPHAFVKIRSFHAVASSTRNRELECVEYRWK